MTLSELLQEPQPEGLAELLEAHRVALELEGDAQQQMLQHEPGTVGYEEALAQLRQAHELRAYHKAKARAELPPGRPPLWVGLVAKSPRLGALILWLALRAGA
ncbi:MAG: hypothetical protein ACRDHL_08955 [Candidatus Promineifilaceae bacterium]